MEIVYEPAPRPITPSPKEQKKVKEEVVEEVPSAMQAVEERPWVCNKDFTVDPDDEIIMETCFFKFKPGIEKDFV